MAKKSMLARENKRIKLTNKYRARRDELKVLIKSSGDLDAVFDAQKKRDKLPINSSATRLGRRCLQCGRPRGVYRKFAICRICLREQLMRGNVPGGRKSSW